MTDPIDMCSRAFATLGEPPPGTEPMSRHERRILARANTTGRRGSAMVCNCLACSHEARLDAADATAGIVREPAPHLLDAFGLGMLRRALLPESVAAEERQRERANAPWRGAIT